jgi:hypothetical protein
MLVKLGGWNGWEEEIGEGCSEGLEESRCWEVEVKVKVVQGGDGADSALPHQLRRTVLTGLTLGAALMALCTALADMMLCLGGCDRGLSGQDEAMVCRDD